MQSTRSRPGDALAFCDRRGVEQFDLVAHDWGADARGPLSIAVGSSTAVPVPHPETFADAYAPQSNQREMSSYIEVIGEERGAGERTVQGGDTGDIRGILEQQVGTMGTV